MKILCIGHAAYDITFPVDHFVIENTKNRITERVECGGGPASNAAYLLGKYGADVYFMGLVGNDYYGNKIEEELKSVNVNTKYLKKIDGFNTTLSTIIANKENGSRTILTYRTSKMSYPITDIDFTPDIILVDGQEIEASNYMIDKYKDAITVIDAGRATDEIIALSKKVDYLVCSHDFAEAVTNIKTSDENYAAIFNTMEEKFKNNVFITLEAKGCLYKNNGKILLMPSISVKPIDSTGAGDLFHGAFVYCLSIGYPIEEVIKISNIVGALSVTKIGGRFSVPTKEEIKNIYANFR